MSKFFQLIAHCISLMIITILLSSTFPNPTKKFLLGPTEAHKTIYVSSDFTEGEFILVQEAAEEWGNETHGLITFEVFYGFNMDSYNKISKDPDSMVMVKAEIDSPLVELLDKKIDSQVLGYYLTQFKAQTILLVPERMADDDYYRAVMIHEMGHSIGLSHINNEDTIMYKSMNNVYHLTKADINWFCRAYFCDANSLGGH